MLAARYPQGRRWFYVLAIMVAVQRVVSHAHYVSDVILGGLFGWAVATLLARRMAASESEKPESANGSTG
jgi:membrane-associated phospholipid phosphatase